ncbi:hypothetical protein CLOP_g5447, partial [Closterium sp. NIES-67]
WVIAASGGDCCLGG